MPYETRVLYRNLLHRLNDLDGINKALKLQRVPREFSRRTRALSDGLKAEEFRNLSSYLFPCVLQELKDPAAKKLLAAMCFLMRCTTPRTKSWPWSRSGARRESASSSWSGRRWAGTPSRTTSTPSSTWSVCASTARSPRPAVRILD